ncbi:type I methionyl aminopeptidase [Candidatus Parcubacteria bacterium]|nr:type I methionyl aminopeptidase [Candidatus Parcubacteria bacterium]
MISIKTKEEIKIMAEAGKILAKIMKQLTKMVEPGITTKELNRVAEDLIFKYGAEPGFKGPISKGYGGFPTALCTSINQVIVHGVPSDYKLKQGDILSLDLGLKFKGFFADMAVTVPIGEISPEAQRLIRVTKKALKRGIKKVQPGNTFGDIGNIIQRYVESQGFNVVRELCGHGIGKKLHEEPQILNYGKRRTGPELVEGMVFCLEPMVTMGDWRIKKSKDGNGFETADSSLSAHFEHQMAVTQNGCQVLTSLE